MNDRPQMLGFALILLVVSCKGSSQAANTDGGDAQAASVAAADDHARAGFRLWDGDGDGGAKDQPGAQKLFTDACAQGSQLGCTGLALTYLDGVGGTGKDYKKAVSLLQPACDAKIPRACSALGNVYADGEGVAKDENKAGDLYKIACDGGEPRGCFGLGLLYAQGHGGLPKDEPHALTLMKTACDGGVVEGCYAVAIFFRDGAGSAVAKSPSDAAHYAQLACDGVGGRRSADGCKLLGLFYDDGTGVPKDRKKERELLATSCDLGSASGCAAYGGLMLRDGMAADRKVAAEAFGKACDGNDAQGCYGLATCERQGWGTDRSPMSADDHLKKACDLGSASACREYRR